jgi:Carboxypeptidase regulatory-like domain
MNRAAACLAPGIVLAVAFAVAPSSEPPQSESTIRLRVRVEDQAGKPVANARANLFKMIPPPAGTASRGDVEPVITKAGSATSPKEGVVESAQLPTKAGYVLEIHAKGFAPELSRWTHPQQSGTVELPTVKLKRLGTIAGKVVDRRGQRIAKVTVIHAGDTAKRIEAVTDKDGDFRLGEVPEGRAIVCIDAAGYRFHGTVLGSPSEGARIELERVDEANPRVLKPAAALGEQWSVERRRALVKKLLEPSIARVLAEPVVAERDQTILFTAIRLEPERILPRLETFKFERPYMPDSLRFSLGYNLLQDGKPEAALEAIGKFKDPATRAQAYIYWFSREPAKTRFAEVHRTALAKAREIFNTPTQLKPGVNSFYLACELGTQLWDIGDHGAARKIFQDCEAKLDKMKPDAPGRDSMRLQLAMGVARDDLERAKKLTADVEPGQRIHLAADIARTRPKDVEPFLADLPGDLSLIELRGAAIHLPKLCLRLARHDPAAAERLLLKYARVPHPKTDAEKMFGLGGSFGLNLSKEFIEFQVAKLKASCYGLIAEGALARDPAAARHALLAGIEEVKPMREGFVFPMSQEYHGPSVLMAMLVPVAERIDPALAREVFWRALSLRIGASGESSLREKIDMDACLVASLVRFYDRELSESLMEPLLLRWRSRTFAGVTPYFWLTRSLALDSPDRALAWADSLCDLPSWNGTRPRKVTRQMVFNALTLTGSTDDGDRRQRLMSDLTTIQNSYGVYVDRD